MNLGGCPGAVALRVVGSLLAALATACSPYPYAKEVAELSGGIDDLSAAFTTSYAGLSADRAAELNTVLIARRARVRITPCGRPADPGKPEPPCLVYPWDGKAPVLIVEEQQQADILAKVKLLRD